MKKSFTIIVFVFLTSGIFAQAPQKMSCQALLRNSSNQLITNKTVGMRISILRGSLSGTTVYTETQTPNTNANGLITIEIGGGTGFDTITWANGPYFIKTETDPAGGSNYTITATSQLLSIPFAFYASKAGNTFSGNYNDLTNKPDLTKLDKDSTDNVTITGNQNISGIKTFIETVTVPTPVNNTDAANKQYVDNLLAIIQVLQNGVFDYDGNHYNTVIIGNQIWMVENLKVTRYRNGDPIPKVQVNSVWTDCSILSTGARCFYNNDSATYAGSYGALYNWYAVVDSRNVCPSGWHIPTNTEWTTLETYLGGVTLAGGKLKEKGITHWNNPNIGADNSSGFTALPGGARSYDGVFSGLGSHAYFWSSTAFNTNYAYYHNMHSYDINVSILNFYKTMGQSVRCIRD